MFINPGMTVTVSGGTAEENNQLCSAIHQSLMMNGFTNVALGAETEYAAMPMLAQLRAINPDLFDNKITVGTQVPEVACSAPAVQTAAPEPVFFRPSFVPFSFLGY